MREKIAFGLQLLGLLIVAQALVVGVMAEVNAMTKELIILGLGGAVFMIGNWLGPEE